MNLHELLDRWEAGRAAERPAGLTASGLHPICPRQTALRLQGMEPTDDEPGHGANTVGTALHEVYARLWRAADPEAVVERSGRHGTPDVVRKGQIRDLKTLNRLKFDLWAAQDGPPDSVWDQLSIYAHDNGLTDQDALVVDAWCRETGRTATYQRIYLVHDGEEAVQRLEALGADLAGGDPWEIGTGDRRGRGDFFCDRCPFRSPCLGEQMWPDEPPADAADLAAAAQEYLAAGQDEKDARNRKEAAKKRLRERPGTYDGWRVTYSVTDVPPAVREVKGYTRENIRITYSG